MNQIALWHQIFLDDHIPLARQDKKIILTISSSTENTSFGRHTLEIFAKTSYKSNILSIENC